VYKKNIVSYSAMFIAAMALVVSIYEGYELRKHNRLSVRPYLQTEVSRIGTQKYTIGLKNGGLGPAIVEDFIIFANEKKFEFWMDAMHEINLSKFSSLTTLRGGEVINNGQSINLVVLDTFAPNFNLRYILKFKSVYDEEFELEYQF
jgi:hypothetical protein